MNILIDWFNKFFFKLLEVLVKLLFYVKLVVIEYFIGKKLFIIYYFYVVKNLLKLDRCKYCFGYNFLFLL